LEIHLHAFRRILSHGGNVRLGVAISVRPVVVICRKLSIASLLWRLSHEYTLPPKKRAERENQTTSVDDFFRGRPPLRPLARELLRFAREVAWPPRLAKMAATDREGSIAGRIAVSSPCTLI
jgi:hypothetical protein